MQRFRDETFDCIAKHSPDTRKGEVVGEYGQDDVAIKCLACSAQRNTAQLEHETSFGKPLTLQTLWKNFARKINCHLFSTQAIITQ